MTITSLFYGAVIWGLIGYFAAVFTNYVDFVAYVTNARRCARWLRLLMDVFILFYAVFVFQLDIHGKQDCCDPSTLAPEHRLSVFVLLGLCIAAHFYSCWRRRLAPPILEVIVNCLLLAGFVLNIVVGIQLANVMVWFIGNIPVGVCLYLRLAENHQLALATIERNSGGDTLLVACCRRILYLPMWKKFRVLVIVCLPLLAILIAILLLFGQKPDSLVRAFTDTYHQGLSRLNGQCAEVVCGGHFLCTVAAKGHPGLVKPKRLGMRAGRVITCNRQLLVANAFEELLEQRAPGIHRVVRRQYNRVGQLVHRYYGVFRKVAVADLVYLLMKPLEFIFILVLYCCDRNPENRIARQYLRPEDRRLMDSRDEEGHSRLLF